MTKRCLMVLAVTLLAGCSTLEEEFRPVTDSLHTPEMEAAINSAKVHRRPRPELS